jgi:hypothetical protein
MTDVPRGDQQPFVEPIGRANEPSNRADGAPTEPRDPNDEVPVPIVMSPAEVDERAQVVEALREEEGEPTPKDQDDQQG